MRNFDQLHRRLLDEAISLLAGQEHQKFSLDAVALRAEVSKGGLLHHFPTKVLLYQAILIETAKTWTEMFQLSLSKLAPREKGRWSQAYVEVSFTKDQHMIELFVASERILIKHPELNDIYAKEYPDLIPDLPEDGLPEGLFAVIVAACDGMWLRYLNGWITQNPLWDTSLERL